MDERANTQTGKRHKKETKSLQQNNKKDNILEIKNSKRRQMLLIVKNCKDKTNTVSPLSVSLKQV